VNFYFNFKGILQFEEVDHNKPTDVVMPSNSNDMTLLNLDDPGVPNFEANFSVPSTANKQMDTPRSKSNINVFFFFTINKSCRIIKVVIIIIFSFMVCKKREKTLKGLLTNCLVN